MTRWIVYLYIISQLCYAKLYLTESSSLNGTQEFDIAQVFTNKVPVHFPNISGTLTLWTFEESVNRNHNWTGHLLFVEKSYFYSQVKYFVGRGATAVLIDTSTVEPGPLSLSSGYEAKLYNWNEYVFQISSYRYPIVDEIYKSLKDHDNISITITDKGNVNTWELFRDSWCTLFIQISLISFTSILLIFSVKKLVLMTIIKKEKCPLNIAQWILIIEMMCQTFRIIYYATDPLSLRMNTTHELNYYLAQFTAPFEILSTVLLIVYWNESISMNRYIKENKFEIILVNAIIFFITLVAYPIAVQYIDFLTVGFIVAFFYAIITMVLSIYIFHTAPKVFQKIRKLKKNDKKLIQKTKLIFLTGVFSVLWCIPPILLLLPSIRGYPYNWFFLFYMWYISLECISLCQIAVFQPSFSKIPQRKIEVV